MEPSLHMRLAQLQPSPLPSSSCSRNNYTLPPIASIQSSHYSKPLSLLSQSLPSLQSRTSPQPSWHRMSNAREETLPSHLKPVLGSLSGSSSSSGNAQSSQQSLASNSSKDDEFASVEYGIPSTCDFVKKLYNLLEDRRSENVISWGPDGNCFIIKDVTEFSNSILPRLFKHSNFASFVRQLNKYDFHKVRNTDDSPFGEHSWTFRHTNFNTNQRDALENIKRKVPTQRRASIASQASSTSLTSPTLHPSPAVEVLQTKLEGLIQADKDMTTYIQGLERNYQDILMEMVNFQKSIVQQDLLMKHLIQYFLRVENAVPGRGEEETGGDEQQARIGAMEI